jgi:hypothetical protein
MDLALEECLGHCFEYIIFVVHDVNLMLTGFSLVPFYGMNILSRGTRLKCRVFRV